MLKNRENIRILNVDLIIVLIFIFGFLIYGKSLGNPAETKNNPYPFYYTVHQDCAINTPAIRLRIFYELSGSGRESFNSPVLSQNTLTSNRTIALKVTDLQMLRQNYISIPSFILRYHLFPDEKDEPSLSV